MLSELMGRDVYTHFRGRLMKAIHGNFEREVDTLTTPYPNNKVILMDGTTGWKSLETSIYALR